MSDQTIQFLPWRRITLDAWIKPRFVKTSRHLHSLPDYLLDDIGMRRADIDVEIRRPGYF